MEKQRTPTPKLSERHRSPLRLFIITIVAIFMAEVVAMVAVYLIGTLPYALTTLVDAGIMIILIFPVLYYFSFRPLIRQMQKSRQAEESLLQARQLQERFFDSIDTLIAYMDRDFNFIRVNDAYAKMVGQAPEQFTGSNHFELFPNAENHATFKRVVEGGESFSAFEKPFQYPDQPERGVTYWNWSLQPVKSSDGRVEGVVLSLVDVTERKRAEEQLRKAYDNLERRVEDRTEKLRIANTELEDEINIRRRTEDALRESELGLKWAQEIAHLGSWELDLTSNQLSWSDEVYRIFGLQLQEFSASYEAFLQTVHPDDRAAVDEAYSSSIRDGRDGYEIEHRLTKRSTGEIRVVHEKCEHFRNEAGQIVRSIGMVHDVTERKQAERRLAYLASFPERNPNPVIEVDFDGQVHYANPVVLNILPDLADKGLDHPWLAGLDRIVSAFQENQIVTSSQDVVLGERFYQQSFYVLGEDRLIRIYGTDITERKQAEQALRDTRDELELRVQERTEELATANRELVKEIAERKEIERQLRIQTTAMEAAANGILITDRHGTIQWINPALTKISGYHVHELIGQSTKIFRSGQEDSAYYQQMWNTILSGQVWRGEITNQRKDGSLYTEEQIITPVRGNDNEITQFIAIKQDITERKQAEKDIRERDQKEKALTGTIHTMQLDIARDLHDTIGQNISFLRMKLDHLAEQRIRKKAEMQLELQSMARAANESYDLIRGTLAILQTENSTDLYRLFTRYAEQIEERSSFKMRYSSQGEPRFMSAKRMRQLFYIFREILSNIEKHAKANQVLMEMCWESDHLHLLVSDNGKGFDISQIQPGSHYGVRFMRERAELLNGSLAINSTLGSGTQVEIHIPYEHS